jgi:hypothetical protein
MAGDTGAKVSETLHDTHKRMLSRRSIVKGVLTAGLTGVAAPLAAQETGSTGRLQNFQPNAMVDTGHKFFGSMSRGIAGIIEEAGKRWGRPNGYILGQEASGAIVGGLRYGEGTLFTRNAGDFKAFWQGPSLGLDFGGDGARTMMLIYNLPNVPSLYQRFGGMDGSAYLVGGMGMTALTAGDIVLVPIRTGVGARLGLNIGYLKFTTAPTWNPF